MSKIERTHVDEAWAREAYGEGTHAFMKDIAVAARKDGSLAGTVTAVASIFFLSRATRISTGSDDRARDIAARLAAHFSEQVQLMLGGTGRA